MANPIFEAVTSAIAGDLNKQDKMAHEYVAAVTAEKLEEVKDRKSQTIVRLTKLLKKAEEEDWPEEGKTALAKLLASYS